MDFLSMSVGKYLKNNLDFAKDIERPKIFGTNYFLKKDGKYINGMLDKAIWVKWMELRVHDDVDAINTPAGLIPTYEDIKRLFKEVLDKEYTEADYETQFTINVSENLAKIDRMKEIYETKVTDAPEVVQQELAAQADRLNKLKEEHGDYVSPFKLIG
jgi:phosphoenolpyruvate carboxykinase (GTP)